MTKIRTIYTGHFHTEAIHLQSGNKIETDAPLDNNGKGECFSPTDLFATSLGSCILTVLGMAANTHGFSIEGTRIETEKIMATNPRRVGELKLDIYFPYNYTGKEMKIIKMTINTCPVANSLHPDIVKNITFHFPE